MKKRFDAVLLLDEAHAVGVLGPHGRGLAAEMGLEAQVDVQLGTLSKALGVSGGYVCGSRGLIDWLINRARPFIFSTAPPPAVAAAATAAIEFLGTESGEMRRKTLWQRIARMRQELLATKPTLAPFGSAIVPWIVGDEGRALDLARALHEEGILAPAIRYPTVAKGAARLRLTVSAAHTEAQIAKLGAALKRLSADD